MNIHQDADGLAALIAAAEQQDKENPTKPQTCNLEDGECLSCGS